MDINTNNIYRDVTIDQLSEANVGETKKIAGWIENIRDHGGVSFIDLRDMYGVCLLYTSYRQRGNGLWNCKINKSRNVNLSATTL